MTEATLAQPGEFDALHKLRENEPYFLLLGRDRLAPDLIMEWADRNRRKALAEYHEGKIDRTKLEHEQRQSTEAEMVACTLRAYKAGHDADAKTGQGSLLSYTGHEPSEDQSLRDQIARAKYDARRALNNAVGELTGLINVIGPEDPDTQAMVRIVHQMDRLSDKLEPPRPMVKR